MRLRILVVVILIPDANEFFSGQPGGEEKRSLEYGRKLGSEEAVEDKEFGYQW